MLCVALCMSGKQADGASHNALMLLNAFLAPAAKVAVDLWAWPLVTVRLVMTCVEVEIAVFAMLCDNSWY